MPAHFPGRLATTTLLIGLVITSLAVSSPAASASTPTAASAQVVQDSQGSQSSQVTQGTGSQDRVDATLDRAHTALGNDLGSVVGRRAVPTPANPDDSRDATLALRDVFSARPDMDYFEGWEAKWLLARPTDGAADVYSDGYSAPARKTCDDDMCVHYVTTTADKPRNRAWVDTTLRVMRRVWDREVGRLGYQRPPSDGTRGGDGRFDVYLKDLGKHGLFGYCAPEKKVPGQRAVASGYCVLDNDFARSQFDRDPLDSLKVTAAHEFFHAIQFGYDYTEDPWLLESTATWMEEQVADGVNDNRSFLPFGQVRSPGSPLDEFTTSGLNQYGNWPFWDYLSTRFGRSIVKQVWERAAADGRSSGDYSTQALRRVLRSRGGLPRVFAAYAGALTVPGRRFAEGSTWPRSKGGRVLRLQPGASSTANVRVDHLASRSVILRPSPVTGRPSRLRINVTGPRLPAMRAYLTVRKRNGQLVGRQVRLDGRGRGSTAVRLTGRKVKVVTVTLVNASTRYRCLQGAAYACNGTPRDDHQRFRVVARLGAGR